MKKTSIHSEKIAYNVAPNTGGVSKSIHLDDIASYDDAIQYMTTPHSYIGPDGAEHTSHAIPRAAAIRIASHAMHIVGGIPIGGRIRIALWQLRRIWVSAGCVYGRYSDDALDELERAERAEDTESAERDAYRHRRYTVPSALARDVRRIESISRRRDDRMAQAMRTYRGIDYTDRAARNDAVIAAMRGRSTGVYDYASVVAMRDSISGILHSLSDSQLHALRAGLRAWHQSRPEPGRRYTDIASPSVRRACERIASLAGDYTACGFFELLGRLSESA